MPPKRNQRGFGGDVQGDDAPSGGAGRGSKKSRKKGVAAPSGQGDDAPHLGGQKSANKSSKKKGGGPSRGQGVGPVPQVPIIVDYPGKTSGEGDTFSCGDAGGPALTSPEVSDPKGKGPAVLHWDDKVSDPKGKGPAVLDSDDKVSDPKGKGPAVLDSDDKGACEGDAGSAAIARGSACVPRETQGQRKGKNPRRPKNEPTKGKTARKAAAEALPSGQRQSYNKGQNSSKRLGITRQSAATVEMQTEKKGKKSMPVSGSSLLEPLKKDTRKGKKSKKCTGGAVEFSPTEDDDKFLFLDQQQDEEPEGMGTSPINLKTLRKKARKQQNKVLRQQQEARRQQNEALTQQQERAMHALLKKMDEDQLAEYLFLERLICETTLLYLYNEITIAFSGSGCIVQDKESKKTKKKESHRGGCDDFWDIPATDIPATQIRDPTAIASSLFKKYESEANWITFRTTRQANVIRYSTPRQPIIDGHPVFDEIHISTEPTPYDIEQFSRNSLNLFYDIRTFSITVEIDGVSIIVPVTKATPLSIEDYTYHVIVMTRPSDRAQVHLLIEQFSSYIDAFKIVLKNEDPNDKYWLILGMQNRLPSFFKKVLNVRCKEGYTHIEQIVLHEKSFSEIFGFYFSYNMYGLEPHLKRATNDESILLNTSFVVMCELNRISVLKEWTCEGVTRKREFKLKIRDGFPELVRDWAYLSKLIYLLLLAILEKPLLESLPDQSSKKASPYDKTMASARKLWRDRNNILKAVTFFYEDGEKDEEEKIVVKLEWLCGKHITLLRHDLKSCHKVLMRDLGYDGSWLTKFEPTSFQKPDSPAEPYSPGEGCSVKASYVRDDEGCSVKGSYVKDEKPDCPDKVGVRFVKEDIQMEGASVREGRFVNEAASVKEGGSVNEETSVKEGGSVKEEGSVNEDEDILSEEGSLEKDSGEEEDIWNDYFWDEVLSQESSDEDWSDGIRSQEEGSGEVGSLEEL